MGPEQAAASQPLFEDGAPQEGGSIMVLKPHWLDLFLSGEKTFIRVASSKACAQLLLGCHR